MATTWKLDPTHSEVAFKVKHLVITTVTGYFRSFDGTVVTEDETDFTTGKVNFSIDTSSIDTNQPQRDEHLKSADFFNAGQYPQITFVSTSIDKKGNDEFLLHGDLTVGDITKPITLNVEFGGTVTDPYGNFKAGFEVAGKISRKEFGLTWSAVTEAGAVVVSDEVKIQASVQFVKQ
ncbi:polyisoprenoid-binding protein [Parapedobacter defluvii]|uniref:Polyisoprenoid-binding protein n=1 Tax=Parapedobacter defluvii TaxID=2045106 RepID=A0ABQ1M1W1_9SPHI|nr:YceI family protein [Parapedobacter defluvii]RQP17791.1 MAG: polyisoprenoid-binding protein [Parapedobacter sp.]GGC31372.1 polyisoprenoid-binding protein [Parapedobacter defluvii]